MTKLYKTPEEFFTEGNPNLTFKNLPLDNDWRQWYEYRNAHKVEIDAEMDPLEHDLREHARKKQWEKELRTVRAVLYSVLASIQSVISAAVGAAELGDKHGSFTAFLQSLGLWGLGIVTPLTIGAYWFYRYWRGYTEGAGQ